MEHIINENIIFAKKQFLTNEILSQLREFLAIKRPFHPTPQKQKIGKTAEIPKIYRKLIKHHFDILCYFPVSEKFHNHIL